MDAAAWAGWMQAVGSFAAIVGAFLIAQRQHKKERTADLERRRDEVQDELDKQLQARALAVRNMVQVVAFAIEAAEKAVEHTASSAPRWEAEPCLLKMEQLRTVVDSLITANTEHLAVVAALQISHMLVQTRSDLQNTGGAMTEQLLKRSRDRITEANKSLNNLIDLKNVLDDMCRARGLPLEIEDFRPAIQ